MKSRGKSVFGTSSSLQVDSGVKVAQRRFEIRTNLDVAIDIGEDRLEGVHLRIDGHGISVGGLCRACEESGGLRPYTRKRGT
jgi:hypothetical protein